jgi:MerR family transcriptional regulator, light-induced transcriptional regulator
MNHQTANHIAETIEDVTRALAEWTVSRHFEADGTLPSRYGQTWRGDWVAHVESRLRFLVQAVAVQSDELFADSMRWTAQGLRGQSEHRADLELSLRCMREVVLEELPPASIEATGRCIDAGLEALRKSVIEDGVSVAADDSGHREALAYIEAVLSGDDRRGVNLILDEARNGRPIAEIYFNILQPAMHEIGRLWHLGDLNIAEEHLATATTRTVMARLRAYFPQIESNAPRVVSSSVSGDFHDLGLRMATDMLELDGWHAYFLGASIPADVLVAFVNQGKTDMVLLAASTSLHLRAAARTINDIRRDATNRDLKIPVGGSPFDQVPDLWRHVGADAWGGCLQDAVKAANRLVGRDA